MEGYRKGTELIYADKHLYVKKVKRPNGNQEYICYQTILAQQKIHDPGNERESSCTARVVLKPDGSLVRNSVQHVFHRTHDHILADIESIKEMEGLCECLKDKLPLSSYKITPKEIFLQVMAK